MPTMVLRFPGGRYHATPGGHHVNEGVVEWPPSPWRLVRALLACGFTTQRWQEVPPAGRRLVESLSGVLPEYRLPPAALAHSRHYMPLAALDRDREKTTLVFDTFADVGEGVVWVRWPVALDDEAARLFETLTTHLGYLGRSESWVLAASAPDDAELPRAGRAFPHEQGAAPGRHFEQVLLSAPEPAEGYASWRRAELDALLAPLALPRGKKPTKAQQKKIDAAEGAYPADLLDCLQRDTGWWKAQRWGRPPGMRSVTYWREGGALEIGPPASPRAVVGPPVEMMLLALATPSGSRSALPSLERTLPQAELLHRAIVSQLGYGGPPCPELVGRGEAGELLKGHRHAHLLPLDLDGDGRIEHLLVYAPMGLSARAQGALRRLRKTYMKGGVGELQLAVAGAGELADLRALRAGLEGGVEALLGPPGGAREWMTASPFVPPRYLKRRGRATLEGQVAEELRSRGFLAAEVERLTWAGEALPLRRFVRKRDGGPPPPVDVGFALRLRFEEPVAGPLTLGYASHFGLGRLRALPEG